MENPGLSDSKLCVGHGMIHFICAYSSRGRFYDITFNI